MKYLKLILEFIFSPTYFFADYKKSKYRIKDKSVGKLIKKFNWIYLCVASLLALGLYLFSPVPFYNAGLGEAFVWVAYTIIWIFPLSRANEIIYAFYRDAIEKLNGEPSKSTLKFGERIQLAMRSYIELILNFASIYILLPPSNFDGAITDYFDALYFSGVTITTLGYGDISPKCVFPQLLSVYEVLCGFMLIVVSFAVYTGRGLEKKETKWCRPNKPIRSNEKVGFSLLRRQFLTNYFTASDRAVKFRSRRVK
ncbi:potassium channel family protein [Pseudoalteromonas sp. PB2-1]|uniref:potassium channel family protein n=1 Tax=Pseudoalteromonas sp. PB2-1 TaxID=2907242 RepID=UPI00386E13DC